MWPVRRTVSLVAITLFALGTSLVATPAVATGPQAVSFSVSGANGVGQSDQPGVPCSAGGSGASWQYDYGAPISAGQFSDLPGDLHLFLDLHSEGSGDPPTYAGAWIPPGESFVVLENDRGALPLDLSSGSGACGDESLAFDGLHTSGSGVFLVGDGSGAYRQATGSGAFNLFLARVGPGDQNPFQLALSGSISILEPGLTVEVVSATWRLLENLDLLSERTATVVYSITNPGPGDAFGVRLVDSTSPTPGVTPLDSVPVGLGDLAAGESVLVERRYRFDVDQACGLVVFSCGFDASLSVEIPDALDRPATESRTVHVQVSDLPEP